MTRPKEDDASWLLLDDWQARIEGADSDDIWSEVSRYEDAAWEHVGRYCAVIHASGLSRCMNRDSWDMRAGAGFPGHIVHYTDGDQVVEYHRYGSDDGVEPLVISRHFNGIHPDYKEICEEFRLLFDLFDDRQENRLAAVTDSGEDEDVVRFNDRGILIRTSFLRRYAAVKDAHIALYYDIKRYSPKTLDELGIEERLTEKVGKLFRYSLAVRPDDSPLASDRYKSLSRLLGKLLIPPCGLEAAGLWPHEQPKEYVSFIIGETASGLPLEHPSDPDLLGTYFDEEPGRRPHYLTPVFFRREVLGKYYGRPSVFSVRDGHLSCGSLWILDIDNNRTDYVVAYLGDLGEHLPVSEQRYWRAYNVVPDGGVSSVAFQRDFLNQWTEAQSLDLVFKREYGALSRRWLQAQGWALFRPLSEEDKHVLESLHIPLSEEQKEFDEQVLALTRLVVDALNEAELKARTREAEKGAKGIRKLELWLQENGFDRPEAISGFLRDLQRLRSTGSTHAKGDEYRGAAERFGVGTLSFMEAFSEILRGAVDFLEKMNQLIGTSS